MSAARPFSSSQSSSSAKPWRLSVKALVRDAEGRVLVLRRSAASRFNAGRWDFPGGKMDSGEGIEEALRREAAEETGLEIALTRVLGAGQSETPEFRVAYIFFEATAASPASLRISPEHDAFEWAAPADLPAIGLCPQYGEFITRWLDSAK